MRASPVIRFRAKRGLSGKNFRSSTSARMTLCMSNAWRGLSGTTLEVLVAPVDGSERRRRGGFSSQCEGKKDRYSRTAAMHAASSGYSASATPEISLCTLEPPSSSSVTFSPTVDSTRYGPADGDRAGALHHRHEVREAGDVRRARRAWPHHRRDLRNHAAHHHLLAEQVAGVGEARDAPRIDPADASSRAPAESTSHTMGDPVLEGQVPEPRHLALADLADASHRRP